MRNIRIVVEYDGSAYHGWQSQPNGVSIQEILEKKIGIITQEEIRITASGRTDSGVHAMNQIANFKTNTKLPVRNLLFGINSLLPFDIVIKDLTDVPENFHSRYDAKSKIYIYNIYNHSIRSSLYRNCSWHVPEELDVKRMRKASEHLRGKRDFSSFCATGSDSKNHVREIFDVGIDILEGGMIRFYIEADGFLRYMVRNIVGTLVDVGKKRITIDEFIGIIEMKDRRKAGITAPPHGLYLKEVKY